MSEPIFLPLKFETFLQMIKNAVGTEMFRSFFVEDKETGKKVDVCNDGDLCCAYFVSSVLVVAGFLNKVHTTVDGTVKEMIDKKWIKIPEAKLALGDVIVWEKTNFEDGEGHKHIGFYIGHEKAVSTSSSKKKVTSHDYLFRGDKERKIELILRNPEFTKVKKKPSVATINRT